ncbi:MAG TPA: ABC transporter permease [Cyclobacteriaceae bacterium]|nr:ABC transporter permease [Cyclobacteriaceae bacterium]HNP06543.1 ABC transporter permease [Cyclobacteriaceae bacterium]
MNKIFLIIQREFLNRVQKKSFLIATILLPLIFPTIIAIMVYAAKEQEEGANSEVIHFVDESGLFNPEDIKRFELKRFNGNIEDAKTAFSNSDDFGLLHIPKINLSHPSGVTLYTKINPSPNDISDLESKIESQIKEAKMIKFNIDQRILDSLKTDISIRSINLSKSGQEKSSDSKVLFGIGMIGGILIYIFIFVYGAQIMQGVIEEKTSKVVEVIVSSVRPFQLMLGKILGLASVGLLQFLIWIVLITSVSSIVLGYFGFDMPQQEMMDQMATQPGYNSDFMDVMQTVNEMPVFFIVSSFIFYFLGGYLLYGALFAAVGSAVDSPAEAQQFIFPITIPMLISYFALFTFILDNPHSTISIWLSIIPFTSPIAMMGRIGFGVPPIQLVASIVCLIGGFVFTTWVASRIYRIGILMHGSKVSYKVLVKWFMMKS